MPDESEHEVAIKSRTRRGGDMIRTLRCKCGWEAVICGEGREEDEDAVKAVEALMTAREQAYHMGQIV